MDWSGAVLSFVVLVKVVCCLKHPVLLTEETYRWVEDVCHVTSAHGLSLCCGTVHCYESLFCVALWSPWSKLLCVWIAIHCCARARRAAECHVTHTAVHVQEGLLKVTWHTQIPFLCSVILCTHCTPYRIVSYENWFPGPIAHRSLCTVQYRYYCHFLWNLNFFHVFEKSSITKFHANPSTGSQIVPCGKTGGRKNRQIDRQTDRQTDRKTDRETDRQTERQTDRQTDRETDRQRDRPGETNSRNFSSAPKY
jgi:hypothetical protein